MNNDVDEFIIAEKKNSRKEVVGKQRNDLLDCIRSCLDLMQDSLDWNYLKAYYNSDNSKNEDNEEEYDNDVADTGSSLGDPIDWEFESVDPKSKLWLMVAGTLTLYSSLSTVLTVSHSRLLVGEIEMPGDLTKIVFGQVDISTLKVVRFICCSECTLAFLITVAFVADSCMYLFRTMGLSSGTSGQSSIDPN